MTEDLPPEPSAPESHPDDLDGSQEAVRRLLAEARVAEPMPADVAARLDDVLAGLSPASIDDDPTRLEGVIPLDVDAPASPSPVTSLAVHRRRRAAGLLVAAAAIVVGGVVVAQHLPGPGNADGGASAASSAQDRESTQSRDGSTAGGTTSGKVPAPQQPGSSAFSDGPTQRPTVRHGRVVVRPDHFPSDAAAARGLLLRDDTAFDALRRTPAACVTAPDGGAVLRATYQSAPAALVFQRPSGSSQVVDLYVCGTSRAVRSATLPRE